MDNENKNFEYFLLQDELIILNEANDSLGNSIYVKELENIINSSARDNNAETIALVGSWGAGKSSVVSGLEEKFKNKKINERNVKFIWYNAWKYNNDSFRKTFLINATESKVKKEELEKKLYAKTTRIDFEMNKRFRWVIMGGTILIGICLTLLYFVNNQDKPQSQMFFDVFMQLIGLAMLESFGTIILRKVIVEKEITVEREFSPEEFSRDYVEVTEKNKHFSVYVIDDLDRCDSDQTLEILDTIKGYLKTDNRNGIFIIPIDKKRLERILKIQRNYDNKDSVDYFSKIFDVMIEIKEPGDLNLFEMIKKISDEHRFGISNFSISLLCDFLIKTPRDVKKHLNNIRLNTNVLNRQKNLGFINNGVFNDSEYDSLIKIYIIENRWSQFYEWLVKNYKKLNIDAIENVMKRSNILDDELNTFLRRSQSISMKNIFAYHNLKDEGININSQVVNNILDGKPVDAINFCEENEIDLVKNLEHTYHIYIEQRELIDELFPQLFKMYLTIVNLKNEMSLQLQKSRIKFDAILIIFNKFIVGLDGSTANSTLSVFSDELIDYACSDDLHPSFSKSFNKYSDFLLKTKDIKLLYDGVKNQKIITNKVISKDTYIKSLHQIVTAKDQDLFDYSSMLSDEVIGCVGKDIDNVFEDALEHRNLSFIIETIKLDERIEKLYIPDIIGILAVVPKLNSSYSLFKEESLEQDITELEIINQVFTDFPNELYEAIQNDVSITYIDRIVNTVKSISNLKTISLLIELLDFYYSYAKINNTWKPIEQFIDRLDPSADKDVIGYLFNLPFENELKNELYIKIVNNRFNEELVNQLVDDLNKVKDTKLLEYWLQLIRAKTNISINLSEIGTQITLDYSNFISNVLPSFLELDNIYLECLFEELDMNIVMSEPIYDFISGMKKSNPIIAKLIKRINNVKHLEKMLQILPKSGNRVSAYHDAMRNIVSSVRNVDELIDIYNTSELSIDSTDLNIIKNKVEESYPQQKDKFDRISWKY